MSKKDVYKTHRWKYNTVNTCICTRCGIKRLRTSFKDPKIKYSYIGVTSEGTVFSSFKHSECYPGSSDN